MQLRGEPAAGVEPHPPGDPVEAVARFAVPGRGDFLRLARRQLGRYGVEEAALAPEGAVQEASLRLCRRLRSGDDPPVATQEEWDERMFRSISRVAGKMGRWCRAKKRHAPPRNHDEAALLQAADRHAPRPGQDLEEQEYVAWLLDRLAEAKGGEVLRQVLMMRIAGQTNEQIARELALVDVRSVERKFERIRSLLDPYLEAGKGRRPSGGLPT